MPAKVHIDGRVVDLDEARLPVTDHGFLFGDSIFETLRALRGRCAFAGRHLDRLRASAEACRLRIPWSDGELLSVLAEAVAASGEPDAAVRLIVSRGSGPLEPDPTACRDPRLLVVARARRPLPGRAAEDGVRVVVARSVVSARGSHAKTGNYLASVLALGEAREAGAFEALLLNDEGRVTECAGSNVFVVRGGRVATPPVAEGLLAGIARANVLRSCAGLGVDAAEEALWPEQVGASDEVFLTSTLKEVVPVVAVGETRIGRGLPGPITRALQAEYAKRLREETTP